MLRQGRDPKHLLNICWDAGNLNKDVQIQGEDGLVVSSTLFASFLIPLGGV